MEMSEEQAQGAIDSATKRLRPNVEELCESRKLSTAMTAFYAALQKRLDDKMREGFRGWDQWNPEACEEEARISLAKGKYLDAANFAFFAWYNQQRYDSAAKPEKPE